MNQQTRTFIGRIFEGMFALGITNDKQAAAAQQAVDDLDARQQETIRNTVASGMRRATRGGEDPEIIEVQGEEVAK